MKKCIAILVLFTIAFLCVAAAADGAAYRYARVATQSGPLNLRKTASSKGEILEKVPKDTVIPVLVVDDTWCQGFYNGTEGYVMGKYLAFIDLTEMRTLSFGDSGQDVLAMKERLRALGYLNAGVETADSYDSATETAVRRLQAAQGMKETGTAPPQLQALLLWGPIQANPAAGVAQGAAPATQTAAAAKSMKVKITADCADYNHVGNEWCKTFIINGAAASSGDTVKLTQGDTVTLYAEITEEDKVPDSDDARESRVIAQSDLENGFTVTLNLSVKENKGRYSGCIAEWTVTFRFTPK